MVSSPVDDPMLFAVPPQPARLGCKEAFNGIASLVNSWLFFIHDFAKIARAVRVSVNDPMLLAILTHAAVNAT